MKLHIRDTVDATEWTEDLLNGAITSGMTDVQLRLQRNERRLTVRARVNRVMTDVATATGDVALSVMTRIKSSAGISTGPAQSIHDGLYEHLIEGTRHDLRIALFPTIDGETVAIRLPTRRDLPSLSDAKFNDHNAARLDRLMSMANGLILMAGPMGAGKTTSMYAIMAQLGGAEKNVFTVEDPVERILPGATQIQINEQARNGWSDVLRGLRRSDLELLMIGEINNGEQARAALEFANVGAKVVSSIHANDSVGAVHQLLGLSGQTPRLLGGQLRGVISQRLVRILHPDCRGTGCAGCAGSGYRGVRPIHEVLVVDDSLVQALIEGVGKSQLDEVARESGMQTLREAADLLVAEGVTDDKEVVRVLGARPHTPGDEDERPGASTAAPSPDGDRLPLPAAPDGHSDAPAPLPLPLPLPAGTS